MRSIFIGLVRTVPVAGTLQMKTVKIKYKCLVLISLFPEMKLRGLVIYRTELNILSPNFHIHVCKQFIYSQDRSDYFAAAK
jgi:hypothetical protein